jgi:hypothetical protein
VTAAYINAEKWPRRHRHGPLILSGVGYINASPILVRMKPIDPPGIISASKSSILKAFDDIVRPCRRSGRQQPLRIEGISKQMMVPRFSAGGSR